MVGFLKNIRKLPVKEDIKDIVAFINRELLPFIGELESATDTTNEDNSDSFDSLIEPEYIVKSANATLTNERVADDSTEIDLDYTTPSIVSWFLKTASVAFSKLSNLSGLSVLGRASNSSGVMAAITANGGGQYLRSNGAGTALEFANSVDYDVSITGTLTDYVLPSGMQPGDTLAVTLTGNVTLNSIVPPLGVSQNFWFQLCLRNLSGGNFTLTIPDVGTFTTGRAFRTPGQPFGGVAVSYLMNSEEEGAIITYSGFTGVEIWRISSGTAAQAVSGDITIAAGNGGTRVAAITAGVIVNADINASAAIALSKLATQAANTIVANATAGTAVPTAVAVGTNAVVGRVAGNIVAAALVNAQVDAAAAIALSKLATQAADSFVGNFTNAVAVPTARAGTSVAGTGLTYTTGGTLSVTVPLSDGDKGDIAVSSSGTVFTIDSGTVTPAKLAVIASNIGATFAIYVSFAAGAGGAPDDVTIYNANAPFSFRILDVTLLTSTAVALSTGQLFSATGGGGTALSSAMTTVTAGTARNNDSVTHTVATNGSVFLRRSDSGVAGEVIITCVKT